MHIVATNNYEEISKKAAVIFLNQLALKPDSVFGFATGSTPIGMYLEIIKQYREYGYDFSQALTFNLDEYYGLKKNHAQSYATFMKKNLFSQLNIKEKNINIPDGEAQDISSYCKYYEKLIANNPIDIQLLGIGANGHIGFNEPGSQANSATRLVDLSAKTISDNARFFKNKKEVPRQAITMGIATIMRAKKILLIASGKSKAHAIRALVEGPITSRTPASFLQNHPDVTIIIDKEAASLLHKNYSSENGWSDIFIYNKNIYPRHKKILVISPHHDDSAVSCGATISALSEDNIVNVLVMTAGHHAAISKLTRQQKIKCREKETVAESKVLGHLARFGNFKFYDANKKYWSQDLEKFHSIWQRIKPEIVFLPHPHDEHPTHFLSTELVLDYLDRKKIKNTELWHYEGLWSQHLLNSINIVFGFDNKLLGIKNKSIAKHKSQVKRLPLVKASQALSRFRALTLPEQRFVNFGGEPPKIADYVEAYFRVKY